MDDKKRVRRRSLIGPVILIGAGIVLLLNNIGVLEWSVWGTLMRMWPVLLIAAGLDILIGRRSVWGSLVVLVVILALLAGGIWLFESGVWTGRTSAGEDIRQAPDGATAAEVVIAPGVASLHVEALSDSVNLVEGTVYPFAGERVDRSFAVAGEKATFALRSEGSFWAPFVDWGGNQRTWSLELDPDVSLDLEISLGAGISDADLTGTTISDLDVSLGVGRSLVTLLAAGRFRANIDSAIGETLVIIPAGMEARIEVSSGIAARQMPGGFRRQGDVYVSPGYDGADNTVDLEVSQAIGSIRVRYAPGE